MPKKYLTINLNSLHSVMPNQPWGSFLGTSTWYRFDKKNGLGEQGEPVLGTGSTQKNLGEQGEPVLGTSSTQKILGNKGNQY